MKRKALVIGGGPAGLTAALRLSEQAYRVTVIEQESTWGGRLSKGLHTGAMPTVLLGCHHATLALLKTLGTASRVDFAPAPSFEFVRTGTPPVRFRRPLIPAPWCTLLSLAVFRVLSFRDRWRFLAWLERTWERDPELPADLDNHTAEAWLRGVGQSEKARLQAWTPLCRFLLGDDLKTASAALFLSTLIRCFMLSRRHSGLALPTDTFNHLLVDPALRILQQRGVQLQPHTAASQIQINNQSLTGVRLEDGTMVVADWYVAAIPHRSLSPLLPERAVTRFSYFQQLPQLIDNAALTVHLWVKAADLRPRVLLLAGRPFHWIALRPNRSGDRRLLVSLVSTGSQILWNRPDQEIVDLAMIDLRAALPDMEAAHLMEHQIVKEPRAFLSVRPRTTALRPLQQSPFPNFFLAGDWTDTGLPSTLESAIHSGDLCARAIAAKNAAAYHR
ncbi:MAG: hydroxysqualene dehydroxylase HpnE [Nitrospiraceae bacterium]